MGSRRNSLHGDWVICLVFSNVYLLNTNSVFFLCLFMLSIVLSGL
jgi:hypothetical protein